MRIAGNDGPGRRALPVGEILSPIPLLAVLLLVVNDRVLKHAAPGWLTGKISDFAGMLFFPLFLTAAGDLLLYAAARGRVDFSLHRGRLAAAVGATGAAFAAIKISPAAAHAVDAMLRAIGLHSRITPDPTDLTALVMLAPSWMLGVREIRRVPLGRLEVIERQRKDPAAALADVGAPQVPELAAAFADWLRERSEEARARAEAALGRIRGIQAG